MRDMLGPTNQWSDNQRAMHRTIDVADKAKKTYCIRHVIDGSALGTGKKINKVASDLISYAREQQKKDEALHNQLS